MGGKEHAKCKKQRWAYADIKNATMKYIQVSFVINNVYNYDSEFGMKMKSTRGRPSRLNGLKINTKVMPSPGTD